MRVQTALTVLSVHCEEEKRGREEEEGEEEEEMNLGGGWHEGIDPAGVWEWGELGMNTLYSYMKLPKSM